MNKFFLALFACLMIFSFVYAEDTAVIENILNRKSVRQYTTQDVEKEKIDAIIKSGMSAPSAVNLQPWEIVLITDKKVLSEISKKHPYASFTKNASIAIVVCGNSEISPDYWIQDCSAVTENILLATESLGLGAVWCGVYPSPDRVSTIQQILKLPKNIIPLNVIPIGYPKGENLPKQKYNPSKIHINSWTLNK
ncbi:MAG: nitroreductase family protein [Endomicrobiaceae bacterium]|nr:nitroreductase family protein [Endomicrobiaceae bacterium]